jgi:uncharacterized OsmC-like protein
MSGRTERVTFGGPHGERAAVLDAPPGPPAGYALFAHGAGAGFDPLVAALAERGVAVLRLELAEADGSDEVRAAADFLRRERRAPVLLVGHGVGGSAVLAAADSVPEAHALAALNPPGDERLRAAVSDLGRPRLILQGLRPEDAEHAAGALVAWAAPYLAGAPATAEPLPPGVVEVRESGRGRYAQVVSAGRHRLRADEPVEAGGGDTGPSPYEWLVAALGACTSMTVRMYAERKQWPLEHVSVRLRHRKRHAQDCQDCEARDARLDHVDREVSLTGPLDPAQRQRLLEIANRCPVHRTLEAGLTVTTTLGG